MQRVCVEQQAVSQATFAAKAYAGLFLRIAGASPTEFAQFNYEETLEVEKSPLKKELSTIKFRAGAMQTLYGFIAGIFLDSKVPDLSARKMRKHKSFVQRSACLSPSTLAASLSHTEAINVSTYAEATLKQQEAELSRFWQSVHYAATSFVSATRRRQARRARRRMAIVTGVLVSGFVGVSPHAVRLSLLLALCMPLRRKIPAQAPELAIRDQRRAQSAPGCSAR
ncbi:hypothetical protein [Pseudomonas sp. CLCA07]